MRKDQSVQDKDDGNERERQLLDTAARVFLEEGYEAASVGEIARLAQASKQTLYSRFATKADLFAAVIDRRTEAVSTLILKNLKMESPPEEALPHFGATMLEFILSPEALQIQRLLYMESARFPAVARRFYESGPERGRRHLEGYFREAAAKRLLVVRDARVAAEQFCDLICGQIVMRAALGIAPAPSLTQRRRHVEAAVKVFLSAYGPVSAGRGGRRKGSAEG